MAISGCGNVPSFKELLTDKEKHYLLEKFRLSFEGNVIDRFVNARLDNNRDAKFIITARNSETGTGKTTLAVLLAKWWDRNGWNAEKGFLDIKKYLAYYSQKTKSGDVLIFDDAEAGADNRRSMSSENVKISKYWSIFRVKNVVSILTLPSLSMIDRRLKELCDGVLHVRATGEAVPYRTFVDDVTHKIIPYRWRDPETGIKPVIAFGKYEGEEYLNMVDKKEDFIKEEIKTDFDKSIEEILGE